MLFQEMYEVLGIELGLVTNMVSVLSEVLSLWSSYFSYIAKETSNPYLFGIVLLIVQITFLVNYL